VAASDNTSLMYSLQGELKHLYLSSTKQKNKKEHPDWTPLSQCIGSLRPRGHRDGFYNRFPYRSDKCESETTEIRETSSS
jgi:predicted SprT family Zn-dependent metalloprotease